MIAILTNAGSLQIARALSGGELFLAYGAALVQGEVTNPYVAATEITKVEFDAAGKEARIDGIGNIVRVVPCSGILPIKVKEGDTSVVAVDFDFNTQLISGEGLPESIEYQTVCMLGRRYCQIRAAERGTTYEYGDHVWFGDSRETAYTCIAENGYEYTEDSPSPDEDSTHWLPVSVTNLLRHPANPAYYSDPAYDSIVMHITCYDEKMTMGNGLEFEYKVRVFMDNLVQDQLARIEKFAQGTEANGSLILSFMAIVSEDFRTIRNMVSPMA